MNICSDRAALNDRAAKWMDWHQYGSHEQGNLAWCYSEALGAVVYSCNLLECCYDDEFQYEGGWDPSSNHSQFAQLLLRPKVRKALVRNEMLRVGHVRGYYWAMALEDLPGALFSLLEDLEHALPPALDS